MKLLLVLIVVQSFISERTSNASVIPGDGDFCNNLHTVPPKPINKPTTDTLGPRLFGICVVKPEGQSNWNGWIQESGWGAILDHLSANYDNVAYSVPHHEMDGVAPDSSLTLMEIRDKNANNRRLMRWMFLKFDFSAFMRNRQDIEGIYVQGMAGSLGVPFGRFHIPRDMRNRHQLLPPSSTTDNTIDCQYGMEHATPFESEIYPGAFVYKKPAGVSFPWKGQFGVYFTWKDFPCWQTANFQFIVILVLNFRNKEYKPMLSRTERITRGLGITDDDFRLQSFPEDNDVQVAGILMKLFKNGNGGTSRIIPNIDYENCVRFHLYRTGNGNRPVCPPGPFPCTITSARVDYDTHAAISHTMFYYVYPFNVASRRMCRVTRPTTTTTTPTSTTTQTTTPTSTTTQTTTPTSTTTRTTIPTSTTTTIQTTTHTSINNTAPAATSTSGEVPLEEIPDVTEASIVPPSKVDKLTEQLDKLAQRSEAQKKITHGDICIYVWFVLLPPANYIARYFKDSPVWKLAHLGYWIILHIFAHHVGIVMVWVSLGLVMSTGESFFGEIGAIHLIMGLIATIIQMVLIFYSMWPRKEPGVGALKEPPVQHVTYGHAASFLALICIFYSKNIKTQKMILVSALALVSIAAIFAEMLIEFRVDKTLKVFPRRRYFPELERIELKGHSPYIKIKLILFGGYLVLLYGIYFWLVFDQPQI